MKTPTISTLIFFLSLVFSWSCAASADGNVDGFLECLKQEFHNYNSISSLVYTPINSSFLSVLNFSIRNMRFSLGSTPKPQVIITPKHEYQIPSIIYCAKENQLQIRTRSGGHDFEGRSYVTDVPFVIIDLLNLSEVTVDAEQKTAWVGAGATIGMLYYRIAEKSKTLAFPAGFSPTVGVGGHFSGGGYGILLRKYGLAADNVIDARIVDVNGRILTRKSMETVTVFTIGRTLEQNATQLIHRWQYVAPRFEQDLFLRIVARRANASEDGSKLTIRASFNSVFLGGIDRLLALMQKNFPELGLVREDCTEMSWIQAILYNVGLPIDSREVLLNRTQPGVRYYKGKSDYVQKPIPISGFEGIWRLFYESEGREAEILLTPYGGRMAEIPESAIPFPHRAGNLYKLHHMVYWKAEDAQNADKYINWIRRLYSYVAPYVSKSPRGAFLCYRDLDIGVNNNEGW
ncbi:Berberine bridge enzyme-like 18 [Sesamum angolense]|uniref:Berberine bridge enzyme-like 18 n=1 Tax=Sesamum angolense TaxID=2727404 RepID=A0AAE1WTL4_9LAMI|nr:Berberine bridge enzyme-like 18 [Sesamum angolense]